VTSAIRPGHRTAATLVYSSAGELFTVAAAPSSTPADLNVPGTAPAYSPDGSKIAYITGGNLAVVKRERTGTQTIESSTADAQPDWQEAAPGSGPPRNLSYPTINLQSGDSQAPSRPFPHREHRHVDGAFFITYTYQWKRCDAADPLNGTCVDIAGATSAFYTPVTADAGKRLRVQVTADEQPWVCGAELRVERAGDRPRREGSCRRRRFSAGTFVDTPLDADAGNVDGSTPITFTYSWRRCNAVGDLATCVQIPGATNSTYTPPPTTFGFSIRVWIAGIRDARLSAAFDDRQV